MNYRPFSNGCQAGDWEASNCERCTKYSDEPETMCPIMYAITLAYIGTGEVSEDMARRIGYLKADGSTDGRYAWPCTEVEWTPEWQAKYAAQQAAEKPRYDAELGACVCPDCGGVVLRDIDDLDEYDECAECGRSWLVGRHTR